MAAVTESETVFFGFFCVVHLSIFIFSLFSLIFSVKALIAMFRFGTVNRWSW